MLDTMDIISCEESGTEFGNSIYVPEEGEKSASAAGVNEANKKIPFNTPCLQLTQHSH